VGAEDQERLLRGLDFWWLYMLYAGLPGLPVGVMLGALVAVLGWAGLRLRDAVRAEARAA
jgi:hypothetical protein